jgi:hypothetical protein
MIISDHSLASQLIITVRLPVTDSDCHWQCDRDSESEPGQNLSDAAVIIIMMPVIMIDSPADSDSESSSKIHHTNDTIMIVTCTKVTPRHSRSHGRC